MTDKGITETGDGRSSDAVVKRILRGLEKNGVEHHVFPGQELRADGDTRTISGFIPYNSESELLGGWFREVIKPTAFERSLGNGSTIRSYNGHNRLMVLGSTPETLTLRNGPDGLGYDVVAPETQWASDLLVSIGRKDIRHTSFGFDIPDDDGEVWHKDEKTGARTRDLVDVRLVEVSPVAEPAYLATTVSARSLMRAEAIDPDELSKVLKIHESDEPLPAELREFIQDAVQTLTRMLGDVEQEQSEAKPEEEPAEVEQVHDLSVLRDRLRLLTL